VYLAEIATPGKRGFYCSWQSGSQQIAVVFTALLGLVLTGIMTADQMSAWGWRVPLLIGCLIIPIILWLRRSLEETAAFAELRRALPRPSRSADMFRSLAQSWRLVAVGVMLVVLTTTTFYLITAYTPTFGKQTLHLAAPQLFLVTMCVGLSNFVWLPIGGIVSDRTGRRPLLYLIPLLTLATAYPAMAWLVSAPSFGRLLLVELWFSFFFGMYNGAMIPFLTEIMPARVRTAAFSFAYSLATAVFGGFTPAFCTYLIQRTGNKASPALWLTFAAAVSLAGVLLSARRTAQIGPVGDEMSNPLVSTSFTRA
jgi:MFS family permease